MVFETDGDVAELLEFKVLGVNQTFVANGRNVSGQVILNSEEPIKMKYLSIKLEGQANCYWTETTGSGEETLIEGFRGRETLIKLKSFLFGNASESVGGEVIHPAGRFCYPFLFTVPHNLPSSVEIADGYIRYFLKAKICRLKRKRTLKQPFIIVEQIDTNNPIYLTPPGGSVSQEIGCCFPSGMLSMNASLPRAAFCAGEQVLLNVEVMNESSTDMPCIKAKLFQIVKCYAQGNKNVKVIKVRKITGPGVPRGQSGSFAECQTLDIPNVVTSIRNCQIIEIYYRVDIEVKVPCGSDLGIKIPVVIGSIPYRGDVCVQSPMPVSQHTPTCFTSVPMEEFPPTEQSRMLQPSATAPASETTEPLVVPPPPLGVPPPLGMPDLEIPQPNSMPPSYAEAVSTSKVISNN